MAAAGSPRSAKKGRRTGGAAIARRQRRDHGHRWRSTDNRSGESQIQGRMQESVDLLIRNYRVRGHLIAKVDPLGIPRPMPPELEPKFWGLSEADLDRQFSTYLLAGSNTQTLRDIMDRLRNTYCGSISAQFMHIDDLEVREWLQQRMEESQNRLKLSRDEQIRILTRLTDAVIFEEFIRRKFVGAKSFSLEGAESLIPLLDLAIEKASTQGVESIVMAMAHRGRLNVLANIIGKSPQDIFREFEDIDPELYRGGGDVKYHLGYYNDYVTSTGSKVHLSLCFNPEPPGVRQPGGPGAHAGQAGSRRRHQPRAEHGDPDPRRRGVHRRRDRAGDAQPEPVARLRGGRHGPRGDQQPDRLYDARRSRAVRRPTPRTSPRCCRFRSSTSTASGRRPWPR